MTTMPPARRHQLRDGTSIDIEGVFRAKIEVEVTPDIAIERQLHLRRDRDGGWLVYSIPNGAVEIAGDIASGDIVVSDPAICAFLDTFYHLLADPERFGTAEFTASDSAPEVA